MVNLKPFPSLFPLIIYCGLLFSAAQLHVIAKQLDRHHFPPAFIFGAGSSAYQVEGAAFEDGRTPSTTDTYAHSGAFRGDGDVACDEYHKYKEDVLLMAETGLDAYRFSISWSRLIPNGRGPVNPKGLEYYNNLINELVSHGIQPHVTLLHQDVPLVLDDEYGGFTNPRILEDFTAYADVCFREFGDRVSHWTTINEANLFAYNTYRLWRSPHPSYYGPNKLNRSTRYMKAKPFVEFDTYLIAHHVLLAHASVARLYQEKYKDKQHGLLGFSLYAFYFTPLSNSTEDKMATQRSYEFFINWLMHPLMHGDYSESLKKVIGTGLPVFTKSDSEMLKGTFDFIGLNYYAVILAKDNPSNLKAKKGFEDYMEAEWLYLNDTNPLVGDPFINTPWGLQGVLEHFKHVYNNPPILIHENGQLTDYGTGTTSVNDPSRVEYLREHVGALLDSVRNGSNVFGYFAWSFFDLFEFLYGYEKTFGLYYIDFNDSRLPRYPKLSQKWYSSFLKGKEDSKPSKEENKPTFLQMRPQEASVVSTW